MPEGSRLLGAAAVAGTLGILFCHGIAALWLVHAKSLYGVRRIADLPPDIQRSGWDRTARAVALVSAALFLLWSPGGWQPVVVAFSFFLGAFLRAAQAHADLS